MKNIFLETHNIKSLHTGFGIFNLHLLKALKVVNNEEFKFTIHTSLKDSLKKSFGKHFNYTLYFGARRYAFARVKKRYDIWHSLNQNTQIEPSKKMPYVLTIHDVNFIDEVSSNPNHPKNIAFRKKINKANAITYISEFAKTSTHQYFKIPKHIKEYVIYNGNTILDIELPQNYTPKTSSDKPYFFSIGAFTKRKNFTALVEMLALFPEHNLVLAGNNNTGYSKSVLEETITKLNLNDRVLLTGKISETEKQYYLQNCEAFLFPSLREGFGIPPIEAMRFGKPVFISNNTSLPEVGGKHAFYWDHYEPKYMADVVKKGLAVFNKNKTILSENYINHAKSFCWENAAKAYIEVYKDVLQNEK